MNGGELMKKLIISIIGTIIIIITTIVSTFAWFISYSQVDPDVTGYSEAAYFASGDGLTEATAYEITSWIDIEELVDCIAKKLS